MSTQFGDHEWGAYFNTMFPPRLVTPWIHFKMNSTGLNVARRYWDQREVLRLEYEAVHGSDPTSWPTRHPGVVLDAVEWMGHAACLGCQWFHARGFYMREIGWYEAALARARLHQESEGG